TGEVASAEKKARLQAGDRVRLVASGAPRVDDRISFSAAVSLPEMVTRLSVGDRLRYDDGKLEAVVDSVGEGEAIILVRRTKAGGTKLKPEKGINLPDTVLGLSPLTAKDETDLSTVIECADLIGYSFVSRPEDIDLLDSVLARHDRGERELGLIAKIEQPLALTNLPALIARARRRGPFGVMIARGDLAAEIGFERLAEMQEELLWICEAASVPCVWATQVLEDMVKEGIPTRSEMTDAAMAARAECVMLNKGPAVVEAVALLDRLMGRMNDHLFKKTPTLRALKSW
ncbi:MAG: pyruvate kinase, partial [Rhizobium sp.]|nr:pyruvate kinase [Rhizobium sp.]